MEPQKRLAAIGEQAIVTQAAVAAMRRAQAAHRKRLNEFYSDHNGSYEGDPHQSDDEQLIALYNTRNEASATARRERARLRAAINHHLKELQQ
ncbi:hypothetical protein [Burkholderia sp. Ac-20349]|uniref:hypothetical protein n=1 Tax=Burkholderia sp. Ac-20349 TaxID=2703893 RepID=UPI00197B73B5|nr:hypothetical protein [Burkholderia sp. Ac-20349]MBN3839303.1 hypothetical protein [Burkholderia sp. Ac-20349]